MLITRATIEPETIIVRVRSVAVAKEPGDNLQILHNTSASKKVQSLVQLFMGFFSLNASCSVTFIFSYLVHVLAFIS